MKKIILIMILLYFSSLKSYSMETIFNVPSPDITPKGQIYALNEVQTTPWYTEQAFFNTILSSLGIGNNSEVNLMLFNVASPATDNISMGVGFKSSVPLPILKEKFPEREIKFTVGSNLLIGLQGNGVGNWTYTHLSGRLPKVNTRLTAGVSYGGRQFFNVNSVSFIAGVEQPVTEKIAIIGDWFSGNEHWSGYLIVGGSYKLPKDTTLYLGFQIPNTPTVGAPGFVIQVGKYFK